MDLSPIRLTVLGLAFMCLMALGGAALHSAETLPFVGGIETKLGIDRLPNLMPTEGRVSLPHRKKESSPAWARELENSIRSNRLLSASA